MAVRTRVGIAGLAWLVMSSSAAAHPGHGRAGGDFSALHYLIEPQHVLGGIVTLVLVISVWHLAGMLRTRVRRRS